MKNALNDLKKYIYTIKGAWLCQLTHWTENGLEDLESYIPCNTLPYQKIYFDNLKELEGKLSYMYEWVDLVVDDERITVRWYTTEDDFAVKKGDPNWILWTNGEISLWEHIMDIELNEIYLNQTINSFDEIR